jgi:hypothetical protein
LLQKDKFKLILFAILVVVLVITYSIFGEDHIAMKIAAGSSLAIWLVGSRLIINKKFK